MNNNLVNIDENNNKNIYNNNNLINTDYKIIRIFILHIVKVFNNYNIRDKNFLFNVTFLNLLHELKILLSLLIYL
jgi:hypothetical protein